MTMSQLTRKKIGELKCIRQQHLMMAEATARNREALLKLDIEIDVINNLINFMKYVEVEHRLIASVIGTVIQDKK